MIKRQADGASESIVSRLRHQVQDFLSTVQAPGQTLLLALSGGLDSMVLLDLLSYIRLSETASLSPLASKAESAGQAESANKSPVFAVHVHHGLSPNADDWSEFCRERCELLGVPFKVERVKVDVDSKLGIEAAARQARYQALLDQPMDYVLLAHHQDDQAETLLLQLLRGAGVKGLAAMPARQSLRHSQKRLLRPLLDVSRADILAYAKHRQLVWIEDESNSDTYYDRNFCRHEIFPVLERRFPAAKQTLARSASHMAEAMHLLDDLAALDAQHALNTQLSSDFQLATDSRRALDSHLNADDELSDRHLSHTAPALQHAQLNVQALARLSEARAKNLLRWWLSSHGQPLPSARRLQEMLKQLLSAKPDAVLSIRLDTTSGMTLRRYQGLAYIANEQAGATIAMLWQGEAALTLPDGSRLQFEKAWGKGLAYQRLHIEKLRITQRLGGERFKPDAAKPTRTLKHLLQETGMPPWLRQRLPLIYCDDALAVVPGIGVASHMQASPHEDGLVISWLDY